MEPPTVAAQEHKAASPSAPPPVVSRPPEPTACQMRLDRDYGLLGRSPMAVLHLGFGSFRDHLMQPFGDLRTASREPLGGPCLTFQKSVLV